MAIIIKLKFLFSVLLIACLFLPLAQCSTDPKPEVNKPDKELVENNYAFKSVAEIGSWLNAIALLAPFSVLLFTYRSRHKIKVSLVALLLGSMALYVIFSVTFWSDKILIGGYVAYISAVSLILLALVDLWLGFRCFQKQKNI